jgi:hypothetical protein
MADNEMPDALKNIIVILVLGGLLVGGLYLYQRHDQHMQTVSAESLGWPSVSGLVTHSSLETTRKQSGGAKTTQHRVDVIYEYVVDDHVYRNDVVRFDQGQLSTRNKERLVSTHPVGMTVQVFYDPASPGRSVLVRGSY